MKRTPGKTVAQRERYWTKIITEARLYSSGVKAYCKDKNISVNSYYFWFKRLRLEHPEWLDLDNSPAQRNSDKLTNSEGKMQIETEVLEKAKRRKFTSKYKEKILRETDEAPAGQIAAILRREGLYTSHLQNWRAERDEHALAAKKRGPKANPLASENKKLKAENARLARKLEHANALIDLQKKIAEILGTTVHETEEQE
jgi:transposase-like protein